MIETTTYSEPIPDRAVITQRNPSKDRWMLTLTSTEYGIWTPANLQNTPLAKIEAILAAQWPSVTIVRRWAR